MTRIISPELLFGGQGDAPSVKFAKVAADYSGGKPALVFDGEDTATTKRYPYLASYTPAAGDRVMLIRGVVVGKIL